MKKKGKERHSYYQRSSPSRQGAFFHTLVSHITPEVRHGIVSIFFLTCGVLFALSLMGLTGRVGVWIAHWLGILFGATKIFIPIAIALFGMVLLKKESQQLHGIHMIGLALALAVFTSFWHLQYPPSQESLTAALEGNGGGVVGYFLSYSLQMVVGFWGALVILTALFLSALLVICNLSLHALLARIGVACKGCVKLPFGQVQEKRVLLDDIHAQSADQYEANEHQPLMQLPDFSKKTIQFIEQKISKKKEEKPKEPEFEPAPSKKRPKINLSLDLLRNVAYDPLSVDIKNKKIVIQRTLENFGIPVEMGEVNIGPTVTQFTLKPAEGVRLTSITALHNDLALALAAHPIRIEAPIPGKSLVGLEVPNQKVALVTLRQILESEEFQKRKNNMHLVLGKDVSGKPWISNILSMPHLLIAGSTGSGKTVCINTIIMSLLFQNGPDDLKFILIDPKRVELPCYNDIPHLITPVITDVKKTINALRWSVKEMERRFDFLSKCGKRDISSYNAAYKEKLPYIVIVIDELADIMATVGPEAESLIIRLAQMARAVGIHLILATQRPSVDVITGLIKANITSRIAFVVASQMDSRTILDCPGAERLIGRGDMLFISSELSKPVRIQGSYVSDEEIERVVGVLKESGAPTYEEGVTERNGNGNGNGLAGVDDGYNDDEDDLLSEARAVILQAKKASASLLQRRLRVGYARAARLLDLLEAQGLIGPADGAKPRQVFARGNDSEQEYASEEESDAEEDMERTYF
jgi:S-DNA-T family DNA segregation ATPase FtsK/SpoIIIE